MTPQPYARTGEKRVLYDTIGATDEWQQRSRRAGTGPIIRPAEPAGIAILESNVADILADYREWSDAQPRAIKTHGDRCHMWHERCMIDRLADALGRARLTDAEREAVAYYVGTGGPDAVDATLRTLLERTK